MRPVDALLDQYSDDHRNHTNQVIHLLCVPAIVWSVTALLWTIPVPPGWFRPGAFAGFAMVAALAWEYLRARSSMVLRRNSSRRVSRS